MKERKSHAQSVTWLCGVTYRQSGGGVRGCWRAWQCDRRSILCISSPVGGDLFGGQWRVPGVFRWMDRGESVNILLVRFGGSVTVSLFINSFSVCTSPPSPSQCLPLCISLPISSPLSLSHTHTHAHICQKKKMVSSSAKSLITVCVSVFCSCAVAMLSPLHCWSVSGSCILFVHAVCLVALSLSVFPWQYMQAVNVEIKGDLSGCGRIVYVAEYDDGASKLYIIESNCSLSPAVYLWRQHGCVRVRFLPYLSALKAGFYQAVCFFFHSHKHFYNGNEMLLILYLIILFNPNQENVEYVIYVLNPSSKKNWPRPQMKPFFNVPLILRHVQHAGSYTSYWRPKHTDRQS